MFSQLLKYHRKGSFALKPEHLLSNVCNAPADASGVYLAFALDKGTKTLIYIGRSGKEIEGKIKHRHGGIKDRLVNGKQFGDRRANSWPRQMKIDAIEHLQVDWFVTHSEQWLDCPTKLEKQLLNEFEQLNGHLPAWNKSK